MSSNLQNNPSSPNNADRVNGEARCFLCLKDKLEEYTFQPEDFLSFILKKRIYCQSKPQNSKTASSLNKIQLDSQILIKPCKCGNYVHIPCLIQHCILHLSFKCTECQADYCLNFQPYSPPSSNSCEYIQLILLYILVSLLHIGLLVLSIVFFLGTIIPTKFAMWNYFLGIIILLINALLGIGNYSMLISKSKTMRTIYPVFANYSPSKTSEVFSDMQIFLEQVFNVTSYELIEKKTNNQMYINTTLLTQRNINEYIITNNNEIFDKDSERVKDEMRNEELEKKFHGHQIIKSTLVLGNDDAGLKNILTKKGTKTSKNLAAGSDGSKLPKSRTKNAVGLPSASKKDVSAPRRSLNMEGGVETKERVYGDEVMNSKSRIKEDEAVNVDAAIRPTIEQQAVGKLTLMKNSSNSMIGNEPKEPKDEVIQVKKS